MKDVARKELKKIRENLSKKEVLEKSRVIGKKLFYLNDFEKSHSILFYVSFNNEVFTHTMIKKCLNEKEVVVPLSNIQNETLILSKIEKWEDLHLGSYGILEPKRIIEFIPEKIDLIIVPGVGFDDKGNRLGHGKGYYDKLLQKTNARKIGLAFECQIVDKIPTDENDVPVDLIITEKRVIRC